MRMRVTYEKLFNLGNYENERIGIEDELGDGENYETTYLRLRLIVHELGRRADPIRDLEKQIRAAESRAQQTEYRAQQTREQWQQAADRYNELRALLERHGAEIEPLPSYLVPPAPVAQPEGEDRDEEDEIDL